MAHPVIITERKPPMKPKGISPFYYDSSSKATIVQAKTLSAITAATTSIIPPPLFPIMKMPNQDEISNPSTAFSSSAAAKGGGENSQQTNGGGGGASDTDSGVFGDSSSEQSSSSPSSISSSSQHHSPKHLIPLSSPSSSSSSKPFHFGASSQNKPPVSKFISARRSPKPPPTLPKPPKKPSVVQGDKALGIFETSYSLHPNQPAPRLNPNQLPASQLDSHQLSSQLNQDHVAPQLNRISLKSQKTTTLRVRFADEIDDRNATPPSNTMTPLYCQQVCSNELHYSNQQQQLHQRSQTLQRPKTSIFPITAPSASSLSHTISRSCSRHRQQQQQSWKPSENPGNAIDNTNQQPLLPPSNFPTTATTQFSQCSTSSAERRRRSIDDPISMPSSLPPTAAIINGKCFYYVPGGGTGNHHGLERPVVLPHDSNNTKDNHGGRGLWPVVPSGFINANGNHGSGVQPVSTKPPIPVVHNADPGSNTTIGNNHCQGGPPPVSTTKVPPPAYDAALERLKTMRLDQQQQERKQQQEEKYNNLNENILSSLSYHQDISNPVAQQQQQQQLPLTIRNSKTFDGESFVSSIRNNRSASLNRLGLLRNNKQRVGSAAQYPFQTKHSPTDQHHAFINCLKKNDDFSENMNTSNNNKAGHLFPSGTHWSCESSNVSSAKSMENLEAVQQADEINKRLTFEESRTESSQNGRIQSSTIVGSQSFPHSQSFTLTTHLYSEDEMTSRRIRVRLLGLDSRGIQIMELEKIEPGPFGFYIASGVHRRHKGIYISRVSARSLIPLLMIGDEILEINGVGMRGKSLEAAQLQIANRRNITLAILPSKHLT